MVQHTLQKSIPLQPEWAVLALQPEDGQMPFVLPEATAVSLPASPINFEQTLSALPTAAFNLVALHLPAYLTDGAETAVAHARRMLYDDGWLALYVPIVPGSRLRGKKARLQRLAGEYVNLFMQMGNAGYGRALSLHQWQDILTAHHFVHTHQKQHSQTIDLHTWLAPYNHTPAHTIRTKAMLLQAPAPVQAFLTPSRTGDRITFQLLNSLIICNKHK
ncbi:MAG: hypothetical protein Kow0080_07000 [Candidatus Promineifilaceae bacterium]